MRAGTDAIGDWPRLSAARFGDRVCITSPDGDWTFSETNERINRLSSGLAGAGVGPGDRIAILAPDGHRFVETVMAAAKLGATIVPLNFRFRGAEVAAVLARATPSALVADGRYLDELEAGAGPDGTPVRVCLSGAAPGWVDYEELLGAGEPGEPPPVESEAPFCIAFTSGTTGTPKGVVQSSRMFKSLVLGSFVEYGAAPEDVWYTAAPLFHVTGMHMMLRAMAAGHATRLRPQFDAAAVLDDLRAEKVSVAFLVPTMISSVLALPGALDHSYERLRLLIYGAATMPAHLLRKAIDTFGCEFINLFGAGTEAGPQTRLTWADHQLALREDPALLESIGRPAFGVELKLTAPDRSEVAPGEIGEITTRSEYTMDGYLDQPEATSEALVDGWIRAGDLAVMDERGYLYLKGRRSDMIIRGGENIYPAEIESILSAHPGVREAAVLGEPDEHWGEVVCAFVILEPDAKVDSEQLRDHCRQALASYKVPVRIEFVDALEHNSTGKVVKSAIRAGERRR